jgi:energy-coupling factor transporter ATP-binding protein EcfA2
MELILENVRSFRGRHQIPIRPLTLLVGENSAGKTTFLAALDAVSSQSRFPATLELNNEPYELGSVEDVASRTAKDGKQAISFGLGYHDRDNRVFATFVSRDGVPALCSLKGESSKGDFGASFVDSRIHAQCTWRGSGTFWGSGPMVDPTSADLSSLAWSIVGACVEKHEDQGYVHEITDLVFQPLVNERPMRTLSLSPLRAKPRRTYDRVRSAFDPEGDRVPYMLSSVLRKPDMAESLRNTIQSFGQDAGLFQHLKIRRLGDHSSDPFQIVMTLDELDVNISDVGYGVSQSLPIVVESVLAAKQTRLLIQQPEVHLHPRAQAALGTFFAKLVASTDKHFVIETHSDYFLDRVRREVAQRILSSKDVSILFFDRVGTETKVHILELDTSGNVIGAPPSYRQFFLEEEIALLTRTEP